MTICSCRIDDSNRTTSTIVEHADCRIVWAVAFQFSNAVISPCHKLLCLCTWIPVCQPIITLHFPLRMYCRNSDKSHLNSTFILNWIIWKCDSIHVRFLHIFRIFLENHFNTITAKCFQWSLFKWRRESVAPFTSTRQFCNRVCLHFCTLTRVSQSISCDIRFLVYLERKTKCFK